MVKVEVEEGAVLEGSFADWSSKEGAGLAPLYRFGFDENDFGPSKS